MTDRNRSYRRAMALAALSGFKVALGPAFLETRRGGASRQSWALAALGEMFFDKVGVFPPRYRPSLLIPHTLAGAWVAHESLKDDGVDDPMGAVMGAAVAAGVATVAPIVRMAANSLLGVPDALLGVAEDYLAVRVGCEATGVSFDQVRDLAQDSIGEVGEKVRPVLAAVGQGS